MTDSSPAGGQTVLSRRHFVIGATVACASAVSYARIPTAKQPVISKKAFEAWIPNVVGPWKYQASGGVLLPPPDELSDRLYDNLVTRVYTSPGGPPVMFLIAYNNVQDGVLQAHRPEVCYPAGGYKLIDTKRFPLPLTSAVPATAFTAVSPDRTEHVVYWTRAGSAFPTTWLEQRIAIARANLRGEIPDGVLVRASLVGSDDQASAVETLSEFLTTFERVSPQQLKRILLG